MAIDWAVWQAICAGAGLVAAFAPAASRTVRRLQIRAELRQNLDLASAVREHGPSVELDPVLTELIAENLTELARLEGRRLRAAPSGLVWKAFQLVSVVGWGFAAALAITSKGGLRQDAIGLVISTLAIDVPLLVMAVIAFDLVRPRSRRVRPGTVPREITLTERTRDLAEELVTTTLPLGRRETFQTFLDQRAELGSEWRVGRAAVPPSF